ncbi:MAG: hypothetical protein CMH44_18665 [Muricauda sp.]|nr:hypothetical protein [Allomuricauda sp.]
MMVLAYLFVLIVLVIGILWIINVPMLSKWKNNKLSFGLNTLLFIIYTFYLIYGNPPFIGHDEYGIRSLWFIILFPIIHIVINILFSIVIRLRFRS